MASAEQIQQAKEIAEFVIENGRVEGDASAWLESLRVEVEFEASERELDRPDEIAAAAVELYG